MGLALLLSWAPWLLLAAGVTGFRTPAGTALLALGGTGPLAAALIMLFTRETSGVRRDYFRRLFSFRLIPGGWYPVIFAGVPGILLGGAGISALLGEPFLPQLLKPEYLRNPAALLPMIPFVFLFGPLPEEPGWRGYALPGLLARMNGAYASLLVGAVHGLWHLPLFFIDGYPLADHLASPAMTWAYFLMVAAKSFLYTWVYAGTGGSILAAVLIHFMVNYTGMVSDLGLTGELAQTGLYILVAAVLVLTRRRVFLWGNRGGFHGV